MRAGPASAKASSFRSRCLKFHNFVPAESSVGQRGGAEGTRLQEQHGTKKITVASSPWLAPPPAPTALLWAPALEASQQGSAQLQLQSNQPSSQRGLPENVLTPCGPHPVGGIVPAIPQASIPLHRCRATPPNAANLLALLRPLPYPATHLTPEVTITPIPGHETTRSDQKPPNEDRLAASNSSDSRSCSSSSNNNSRRKRHSEEVRRLLNLKISRKDARKAQRDEQPLDLSLRRDDSDISLGDDSDLQLVEAEPLILGGPSMLPTRPGMAPCDQTGPTIDPRQLCSPAVQLTHVPLAMQPVLPLASPHAVMNPLLVHQLALHRHLSQCQLTSPSMRSIAAAPPDSAAIPADNTSRQTPELTNSGILVKTKQVSEVGGATFCKFRQVKPNAHRSTGSSGKGKRYNFVPSKWQQQQQQQQQRP